MNSIKNSLLYCGLTKEEYEAIRPLINERNYSFISIISIGMAVFGLIFMISWMFGAATVLYPYVFLICSGVFSFLMAKYVMKKAGRFTLPFCYLQIIVIFIFAIILSSMSYNRENPSTSIIVFLALLPVTINDRPVRMFGVVAFFSALYLICAAYVKVPQAHHADVMNTLTFSTVGMLVYLLVSNRNVHEIFLRQKAAESDRLRKEKAAADMANAAKTVFLANMSHEIRTPINAIMGMNEIILRDSRSGMEGGASDPAAATEIFRGIYSNAGIINSAGHNLISIINGILDFSKIESGKMELVESSYDLSSLLNDVSVMIAFKAKGKGLQFQLNVENTLPSRLCGDAVRVRQIITNLLTNAVKYTDTGVVTMTVKQENSGKAEAGQPVTLIISVSDTGIGIREEDMKRLFSRFERMDMSKNSTVEGTGLGLAITKSLLNLMNGSITVESVYGSGSTFTVKLPQTVVSASPIGDFQLRYEENAQEETYRESFRAPEGRILVVDDTRMNITVVERLLKHTQLQIDTAESGMEAISLCCRNRYDLILLDQRMPHMDGTEALRRIRESGDSLNAATPAICLTADAIIGARERYLAEGFSEYLTKPINGQTLEKMLVKFLPAEKVTFIKDEGKARETADSPQDMFALLQAAGIDVSAGLRYSQDDPAFYQSILREYGQSAAGKQESLERALSEENWKEYGICVHALKSTSRGIGANGLADLAARLEASADKNDGKLIREKHAALMELYRQTLSAIAAVIPLADEKESDDESEILEFLPE